MRIQEQDHLCISNHYVHNVVRGAGRELQQLKAHSGLPNIIHVKVISASLSAAVSSDSQCQISVQQFDHPFGGLA